MRKWNVRLCESVKKEVLFDPSNASNGYMLMSKNEGLFCTMRHSHAGVRDKRKVLTAIVMKRTYHRVVLMLQHAKTISNVLMRKAANYTINP